MDLPDMHDYREDDGNPGSSKDHCRIPKRAPPSEADSGYGGSIFSGSDSGESSRHATYVQGDSKLSSAAKGKGTHRRSPSTVTRRHIVSQVNQLQYNDNRVALGRSISAVLSMLKDLQSMNRNWPVYYPAQTVKEDRKKKRLSSAFDSVRSEDDNSVRVVKRAASDISLRSHNDEKDDEPAHITTEPRLVSSRIIQDFNVFKLDLKIGSLSSEELVNTLAKTSVASLLDEKIIQTMRHLLALRDRIDDTSSKVLITGDLNAGKSTFCNALLRRKLLPEDQQPCTSVFCEVIDARENNGVEEVHAVGIDMTYNRSDETTYTVFPLKSLEELVIEAGKYSILKVYVNDGRPVDQSLLRNGVVDISLIDAPGLNMDSYQTTQVFSRQEEIDLVVFVVSAENHFTLSAKEFIWNAAHEKSLVFIVVNRFDNIRDKNRCRKMILDQVADLSPETHKDASDFIHFVSSSEIIKELPDDGDGPDDNPGDDDHPHPDFDQLEASLRDFVLEKRSLSKLAPAKTYLKNILKDLEMLSQVNISVAETEKEKILKDLDDLAPEFENSVKQSLKVSEQSDQIIEEVTQKAYDFTKAHLGKFVSSIGDSPIVPYRSIFSAFDYAISTREAIIDSLLNEVVVCESFARKETTQGINTLKSLGILHLGEQPAFKKIFNDEAMFTRRRDTFTRTVYTELGISDFFDLSLPSIPFISSSDKEETSAVTNALTVASVVTTGQLIRSTDFLRNVFTFSQILDINIAKKLALPFVILASLAGVAYVISDIPNAVPRNISRKLNKEIQEVDYIDQNALRISKECRKVLKFPAQDITAGFQNKIEQQARKKEEYAKTAKEVSTNLKYFKRLHKDVVDQHALVDRCNLDTSLAVD
jgi:mitofusin